MHRKLMKSAIILALLLISTASLSMAACPVAKNDGIYRASCGGVLEVAAPGILANDYYTGDKTLLKVVDPESIYIPASKGILVVNEDGSFVYTAPANIATGTYVTFYYRVTDGTCVSNQALAKIQVACKCHCNAPTITICGLPENEEELEGWLIERGAGCIGCGDYKGEFDLPEFPLDYDCYDYSVACPGCQACIGEVCFQPACEPTCEPFTVCDNATFDEVMAEIMQRVASKAINCGPDCEDVTPIIAGLNRVDDHWEYTITCTNECGPVTVPCTVEIEFCDASSVGFCITDNCPDKLPTVDQIEALNVINCDCENSTYRIDSGSIRWIEGPDENGTMIGEYKFYCISENGCITEGIGEFDNLCCPIPPCPCDATAPPIRVPCKTTLEKFVELAEAAAECNQNFSSPLSCDATPVINTSKVMIVGGFVAGGTYKVECDPEDDFCSATGRITVEPCDECCEPCAPKVCICKARNQAEGAQKRAELAQLTADAAECRNCTSTPVVYYTTDLNDRTNPYFVNVFSEGCYKYKVTCPQEGDGCPADPYVEGRIEVTSPNNDGSCDYECTHCVQSTECHI